MKRLLASAAVALMLATPAAADLSSVGGPKPRPADLVIVSKGGADKSSSLMSRVIEQFRKGGMSQEAFQRQMQAAQDMNLPTKQGASYYDPATGQMRTR